MISLERFAKRAKGANDTSLREMILTTYRQMLSRPDNKSQSRRVPPENINERLDALFVECQTRSRMEIFWEARDAVFVELAKQKEV